jgi:hypothetical protein
MLAAGTEEAEADQLANLGLWHPAQLSGVEAHDVKESDHSQFPEFIPKFSGIML